MYANTGQRMLTTRVRLGMSPMQLGQAAKVPTAIILAYESGAQRLQHAVGLRIAGALGVTASWLLYGVDVDAYTYASVELLGHIDLQACKVREIDDLGGKALEVTALNKDGSDGKVQIVSPAAIYRRHVLTKEEALKDAATRYRNPEAPEFPETKDPPPKPLPWAAFLKLIEHCSGPCPVDVKLAATECAEWYDQEQADIPF